MSEARLPGNELPLVSVIMAAYNCERYVGEAVESICAQTYPNWELIVVDDASSDATPAVVTDKAVSEPRVRLIRMARNVGCFPARNRAVAEARGEFIAVLDADDIAFPDRLTHTLQKMQAAPELGLVGSLALLVDEEGTVFGARPQRDPSEEHVQKMIARGKTTFVHSSYCMRAEVLRELGGYDEFFRYAGDEDLLLRFDAHSSVGYIPEALVAYRHRRGQITMAKRAEQMAYARAAFERYRKAMVGDELDLEREYARQLKWVMLREGMHSAVMYEHYANGLLLLSRGQSREAKAELAQALREGPWSPRVWIRWLQASLRSAYSRSTS